MKRIMAAVLVLCFLVALGACAGWAKKNDKIMTSWEGKHYSQLVTEWGPPQRVMEIADGEKMMVYSEWVPMGSGGYWRHRTFWVNAKGIIYRWAWKGL